MAKKPRKLLQKVWILGVFLPRGEVDLVDKIAENTSTLAQDVEIQHWIGV